MKTLLCATLAVLLVSAVTAQSSQGSEDASSTQGLIDKLNHVISSLGGFEGTVNKLEYITKLVEKAYNDQGIGGWMARNLIKLELSQLKEKAMNTEKDMINHLLDELETKAGLRTYAAADPAENYVLNEAVKKAIAFIRQSIQEILSEISKAQKEHDEAAGRFNEEAMNKVNERLNGLKEKLQSLTKRLFDKLTGRDKTVEVYGGDAGVRYSSLQASSESYILSEMIRVAAEQVRERIFKYVELIGEAKREAQKALGKHKEEVLKHLDTLKDRLRQSMADLKDTLLGRKTNEELEEEIKEGNEVDDTYAVNLMNADYDVIDHVVKDLIGKLRKKIVEVIGKLGEAKREAERAAEEGKKTGREQLAKLREQLKRLTKELKDAILGRKTEEELEKELEQEEAVQLLSSAGRILSDDTYAFDSRTQELIREIREKIIKAVEALGKAREQAGELAGDSEEELAKAREELRKLMEEMKNALVGRKNADESL